MTPTDGDKKDRGRTHDLVLHPLGRGPLNGEHATHVTMSRKARTRRQAPQL
jgi:hypothetical protein